MRGESLSGPPPRRIGIRDVAQRAGVAISTVSKVFSGKGEVMPALRMRVLTAAAELGYQPNYVAQSLRRGATDLIGFVASDLSDPFSAEIVAGAEFVLRPAGYALLVMSSNHDPEIDAANVRTLNSRRVDAVLVSPSREDDRGLLTALAEFDGPIVAIESELRGPLAVDAVCADHRAGMRDAVEHLVRLGHTTDRGADRTGRPPLGPRAAGGPPRRPPRSRLRGPRPADRHRARRRGGRGRGAPRARRRPGRPPRSSPAACRCSSARSAPSTGAASSSAATSRSSAGTTGRSPSCRDRRSRSSTAIRAASAPPPRRWR